MLAYQALFFVRPNPVWNANPSNNKTPQKQAVPEINSPPENSPLNQGLGHIINLIINQLYFVTRIFTTAVPHSQVDKKIIIDNNYNQMADNSNLETGLLI